jgi:hypothetical protein
MNKRKSTRLSTLMAILTITFILQGCGSKSLSPENSTIPDSATSEITPSQPGTSQTDTGTGNETQNQGSTAEDNQTGTIQPQTTVPPIDLNAVKPNEAGRIMVVMFHNFVEEYKKGDKAYTTTFDAFGKLLDKLYSSGYRLISLNDYLNGNIDTPAGCIPMVFTFDDGTAGQFNLIEDNGTLKANPRSAVGVLEEFNRVHPDFGAKATFFVNLGDQTFRGAGTVAQRLEYLTGKGFELGNHTYTHINLKETKSAEKIQEEIGGNQKKMLELIPGYIFTAFSLPYGEPSGDLTKYVIKGEFEGVQYENHIVVEVGWDPAPSPFSVKFDPLSTHRVRASGITPVDSDLAWWLDSLKRDNQYVSDGNAANVTIPESYAEYIDQGKLGGRALVKY